MPPGLINVGQQKKWPKVKSALICAHKEGGSKILTPSHVIAEQICPRQTFCPYFGLKCHSTYSNVKRKLRCDEVKKIKVATWEATMSTLERQQWALSTFAHCCWAAAVGRVVEFGGVGRRGRGSGGSWSACLYNASSYHLLVSTMHPAAAAKALQQENWDLLTFYTAAAAN